MSWAWPSSAPACFHVFWWGRWDCLGKSQQPLKKQRKQESTSRELSTFRNSQMWKSTLDGGPGPVCKFLSSRFEINGRDLKETYCGKSLCSWSCYEQICNYTTFFYLILWAYAKARRKKILSLQLWDVRLLGKSCLE